MSALAQLISSRGGTVRGSDAAESSFTRKLVSLGIPVFIGEDEPINADNIVYTGAIEEQHKQLKAAKEAGKRLISRAELLGAVAEEYPHTVSVAGCHGKTSTTSMLAHIFNSGNRAFSCHIGGEDIDFGNYFSNGNDYFITEACEFRRSFLSLKSEAAVILNTDRDHTDCYNSKSELVDAYRLFAQKSKYVIVNADDADAYRIPHTLSFGFQRGKIQAKNLQAEGEKYAFTVTENGIPVERIFMNVVGKYQVANALAAFSTARLFGFSPIEIKQGLENFHGVKRRFEKVGTICGVPVICDYAHHPREIAASFSCASRLCRGTVRLVFQPHTYTRTRDLMPEFITVLKKAENPLIYKTYAAREQFDFDGSAVALVSRVPESSYVQSPTELRARLKNEVKDNDLILILGAGDIYEIAKSILDETA